MLVHLHKHGIPVSFSYSLGDFSLSLSQDCFGKDVETACSLSAC